MELIEAAKIEQRRAIVLVDEAGKFLSSRFWAKMDPRVLTLLQERRKVGRGLDLWWTAPSWRMIDAQLRDVTQYVHTTKRYGGSEYSHDSGRPPFMFLERTFRPDSMATDTSQVRKKAKPIKRRYLHFSPVLAAMYGTAVLDMSKPMAVRLAQRPDFYGVEDSSVLPVEPQRLELVQPAGRRRGSK